MRLLMTWFTADSTKELEMVSPARWLPVVWDPVGVGPDVGVELTHRLDQSDLFESGFLAAFVELALEVLDGLQGAEDVAVPEGTI